ncbi:MAG: hypothetical protein AAGH81_18760, partial [Bacteroidota bacterium]
KKGVPEDRILGKPLFQTIGVRNGFGANVLQYAAIGEIAKFQTAFPRFLFHEKDQEHQSDGKAYQVPPQSFKESTIDQNIKKLISL